MEPDKQVSQLSYPISTSQKEQYVIQTLSQGTRIAFQGEFGAFSDEAASVYFGSQGKRHPCPTLASVFHAVTIGEAEYGLVPIENSQTGSIHTTYDLLGSHNLFVGGEICHPVNHFLLCLPGQKLEDIKKVISHPQALEQCSDYLTMLQVETIATYNTAGSTKMISEGNIKGVAAVASCEAARLYELEILAHSIQNKKRNYTRFVSIQREATTHSRQQSKTMLVLTMEHQSGALYACLKILASNGINLLRLELRPSQYVLWEYFFYFEIEGHWHDMHVKKALSELECVTKTYKFLGSFTKDVLYFNKNT